MVIFRYIKILAVLFICPAFVFAENLQMESSVDRTSVPLNGNIQLTISITADSKSIPDYAVPQLSDFNIFSTSQSKSISIINGSVKNTVYYVYTLGPKKTGKFTIPSFSMEYKGQTYKTNPVEITVEKAETISSIDDSSASSGRQDVSRQVYNHDTSKAVFVEAKTDKQTAYVNEKITYIFSFWTSVNILSNPNYAGPDFSGFFSGKTTQRNYRTKLKGREYVVSEISTELFPQKEGNITIGKASVQVSIEDFNKMQDDFFASFFRSARNVDLATEQIKIKVLKVPENVDMVGEFNLSATADSGVKKTEEPFNLKITVNGKGNIRTIKEPQIVLSENLKKYETSENILKNGEIETGKEFSTLIMPLEKGEGEIRILPLKFFDTNTKQIKILPEKILKVKILQGTSVKNKNIAGGALAVSSGVYEADGGVPQNVDLSFIFKVYSFLQKSILWITLGTILAGYILFRLFLAYQIYLNKDQQKLKNKKAYRRSKKYFKKARKTKNTKEFYEHMYRGMLEYFASVIGEPADGLTTYKIKSGLEERKVDTFLIQDIENILEECSMHLYSGIDTSSFPDRSAFYAKAFEIMKKLDI